jgi:hypothetical protein
MNTTHPELRDGEIFITNCRTKHPTYHVHSSSDKYDKFVNHHDYDSIGWETKRKGDVAYTHDGEVIDDAYPVFIQLSEYEEKYGKVIINDTK